ncbi:MAG: hydrogenase iron-sulfur subunit [Thermoanaerobacterales bacterium]|nr:hydrogenase iron-sulfur subunit [Bacillota bacterium]MDI6907041.1 hydrogenase iron-sulfur subunit [Thermoanaerobacterales bacterium]
MSFEPRIIAFCCHHCAYGAADLAGVLRLQYPANIRIIRVPCSGRVSEEHILWAFANGADGVCVSGCLEGDCHYQSGNLRAGKRVRILRNRLWDIGLEPERLRMFNISAAMGSAFIGLMQEMTDVIRALGPVAGSGGAR